MRGQDEKMPLYDIMSEPHTCLILDIMLASCKTFKHKIKIYFSKANFHKIKAEILVMPRQNICQKLFEKLLLT